METIPASVKVKSLYKAVKLLDYFLGDATELGVTELAERSGMLKSTVYNILATYEVCGIVERDSRTNKYRLGVKILELSNHLYRSSDIRQLLHPHMERVVELVGENMYLAKLYENEVIYMDAVFPKGVVSGRNMIGIRAKAYCTGIGKAMLAYEPDEVVDAVIASGLEAFTNETITDGNQLKENLAWIRSKGYAIDNMEHEYGIRCVAVPIRNYEGKVVAAWSLSGPSLRFTDDKIEEYVKILFDTVDKLKTIIS